MYSGCGLRWLRCSLGCFIYCFPFLKFHTTFSLHPALSSLFIEMYFSDCLLLMLEWVCLINSVTGDKSLSSPNVTFSCGLVKSTFFCPNKTNVKWGMDCISAFYSGTSRVQETKWDLDATVYNLLLSTVQTLQNVGGAFFLFSFSFFLCLSE